MSPGIMVFLVLSPLTVLMRGRETFQCKDGLTRLVILASSPFSFHQHPSFFPRYPKYFCNADVSMQIGLKGEALNLHSLGGISSIEWGEASKDQPLTWYKVRIINLTCCLAKYRLHEVIISPSTLLILSEAVGILSMFTLITETFASLCIISSFLPRLSLMLLKEMIHWLWI